MFKALGLIHKLPLAVGISTCLLMACSKQPELQLGEEQAVVNETKTINDIIGLLKGELQHQYVEPKERVLRDTHPKSNGCVHGTFKASSDIAEEFNYGVFSDEQEHPVWIRFSNAVEERTSDRNEDFRGFGLKLFNITGERLPVPGDEQHTQDFLFLGHDAFFAKDAEQFFDFFDATFSGNRNQYLITHPLSLWNIFRGAQVFGNQLDMNWFSVTPYRLGGINEQGFAKTTVKYKLQACADTGREFNQQADGDDYLREVMSQQLQAGEGCFDFYLQQQLDPSKQLMDDARYAWKEKDTPFIKVARITIPAQGLGSPAQQEYCENLSFNPWHGLEVHKPLGSMNRARRDVMKAISDFRLKTNGIERKEPTGLERF
jgi:catalase